MQRVFLHRQIGVHLCNLWILGFLPDGEVARGGRALEEGAGEQGDPEADGKREGEIVDPVYRREFLQPDAEEQG